MPGRFSAEVELDIHPDDPDMTEDRRIRIWLGVVTVAVCVIYWNAVHGPRDLVGIGAHVGNVVLLFLICRSVFSSSDGGRGTARGVDGEATGAEMSFAASAAMVAAGCYALHPLASQAVNYGAESLVPVSTLLCLVSLGLFLTAHERAVPLSTIARRSRLAGSYLSYGVALFLSPVGITLPVMLLACDATFLRGPSERSRGPWHASGPNLSKHAPYMAAALGAVVFWQVTQSVPLGLQTGTHPDHSLFSHYLTQTTALALYCLKLLWTPIGGVSGVDVPSAHSLLDLSVLLAVLMLVGLGAIVYRFRQQRALVFWSLWILVCLVPVTYLVRQGPVVAEYRAYFSLAGFCAVVGWGVAKAWQLFPVDTRQLRVGRALGRLGIAIAMLFVLVALGAQTRARNSVWPINLPTPAQHAALAEARAEDIRVASAEIEALRQAERSNPAVIAFVNLGLEHYRAGRFVESIEASDRAIEIEPDSSTAFNNLCVAFNSLGDWEKGVEACTRALELNPDFGLARNNLDWAQRGLASR